MGQDQSALRLLRHVLIAGMAAGVPDLSNRQMAVLLSVYTEEPPHTVRGLAARLGLTKPVITRALDRLQALGFVKRKRDPDDGRNVLVQRTVAGAVHLSELAERVAAGEAEVAGNGRR